MNELNIEPSTLKILAEIIEKLQTFQHENASIEASEYIKMNTMNKDVLPIISSYLSDFQSIHQFFLQESRKNIMSTLTPFCNIEDVKILGLGLIHNHFIDKPLNQITLNYSILNDYWSNISSNLFQTSQYQQVIQRLHLYYQKILDQQIDQELKKVPMVLSPEVIANYKKLYYETPMSFETYLNHEQSSIKSTNSDLGKPITSNNTLEMNESLRKQFEIAIEKKKIEEAKENQQKNFDNYERYFEMDERELKKAKRQGDTSRRINAKQTRREKFQK